MEVSGRWDLTREHKFSHSLYYAAKNICQRGFEFDLAREGVAWLTVS